MTPILSRIVAGTLLSLSLTFVGTVYAGDKEELTFDHLKCFQVRDEMSRRTVDTADLTPDPSLFGKQNCKIKLPATHFCVATSKTNVEKPDGSPFTTVALDTQNARNYLCYVLRCPREVVSPFDATDQFGNRTVRSKNADYFCVPAETVVE